MNAPDFQLDNVLREGVGAGDREPSRCSDGKKDVEGMMTLRWTQQCILSQDDR